MVPDYIQIYKAECTRQPAEQRYQSVVSLMPASGAVFQLNLFEQNEMKCQEQKQILLPGLKIRHTT